MTRLLHAAPESTPAAPHRQNGRTRRLLLVVVSMVTLAAAASCGGDDDDTASDTTVAGDPTAAESSAPTDSSATTTSGDGEADGGSLPDACDVIDLPTWEEITAIDLTLPDQDTGLIPGGGTVCGISAEGTSLPLLATVAVDSIGAAGSVENLALFLDDYDGMEQIDGIGDRALYWDQDTTYEGDAIADRPTLAFEDGAVNVTITLGADGLGRAELELLAQAVADKV
ncbi:MAG: hypothetical protein M5T61_13390 [Acidimicrobiia bacterium]|nr:hypothetical protein [Acidimicrobiia bacterium]